MTNLKKTNNELFSALLYIIIGAVLIIFRAQTLGWAMTIAGVFFIVSGILDLVKQNMTSGAISLIIGIAIVVLGWVAVQIVLLVLGILIAVKGLIALLNAINTGNTNALELVFPILTMVVGIGLAFGNGLDIVIMIVGILMVVDGVLGLVASLKK